MRTSQSRIFPRRIPAVGGGGKLESLAAGSDHGERTIGNTLDGGTRPRVCEPDRRARTAFRILRG